MHVLRNLLPRLHCHLEPCQWRAGAAFGPILAAFTLHHGRKEPTQSLRRRLPVSRSRVVMAIRSLVPELACLSASSPPSSFQSSLTWRKPPSSFKSSLTERRRRASRHRLADYRGHRRRSRRSFPPSSLLSCYSRVLWHSNGAHTLLLIQEFACSSTTRHGSSAVLRLHYQKIGAEPAHFKSRVKTGTAPDTLARHGTALVTFTLTILESRCRAGTAPKWQCKRGICFHHYFSIPVVDGFS